MYFFVLFCPVNYTSKTLGSKKNEKSQIFFKVMGDVVVVLGGVEVGFGVLAACGEGKEELLIEPLCGSDVGKVWGRGW